MITPRMAALFLTVVPLAAIVVMSQQYALNTALGIAAIIGYLDRIHVQQTPARVRAWATIIVVFFLCKYAFGPSLRFANGAPPMTTIGFLNYVLAYNVGQACIAWLVSLLYFRRGNALPGELPVFSAIAVVMAGTIETNFFGGWRDTAYQSTGLLLAALTGLYFMVIAPRMAPRPRPRVLITVLLAAIVVLGWGAGQMFYAYTDRVERYFANYFSERNPPGTVGFPEDGKIDGISDLKSIGSNNVALRIQSELPPGYLRGRAYDTYSRGRWTNNAAVRTIKPNYRPPEKIDRSDQHWFDLSQYSDTAGRTRMIVEREPGLINAVFATLETEQISASTVELRVDAYDVPTSEQINSDTAYGLDGNKGQHAAPDALERKALVALPPDLDPRFAEIAAEITAQCGTDAERANAVLRYLGATCRYDLHVRTQRTKDPVTEFLFTTRRGHCELFASAAVLLLRCAGVPCRYACGFLTLEQNQFGGYWVARNRDAHAWAEMFIEGKGWVTFDATPPSGVPVPEASDAAQLWDYIKYLPKRIVAALREMNFVLLLQVLLQAFGIVMKSIPGIVAVLVFCALAWFRIRKRRTAKPRVVVDPVVATAQKLLAKMDRTLETAGHARRPNETLHHFAARIEDAGLCAEAAWYRSYADARYGGDSSRLSAIRAPLRAR